MRGLDRVSGMEKRGLWALVTPRHLFSAQANMLDTYILAPSSSTHETLTRVPGLQHKAAVTSRTLDHTHEQQSDFPSTSCQALRMLLPSWLSDTEYPQWIMGLSGNVTHE